MAKFSAGQATAIAAINQVINDWAFELDVNNGQNISGLVTEDCDYNVGGARRAGRVEVAKFYTERLTRLSATPAGVPVQRHTLSNLRTSFKSDDEAAITFTLIYFTTAGMSSGLNHADPAAVADIRMNASRGADGEWLISMFDSNQSFIRKPA